MMAGEWLPPALVSVYLLGFTVTSRLVAWNGGLADGSPFDAFCCALVWPVLAAFLAACWAIQALFRMGDT
jgi:hypothetical protein